MVGVRLTVKQEMKNLSRSVLSMALVSIFLVGPVHSAPSSSHGGEKYDMARLRARVDSFHEALISRKARKVRRMILPQLRDCKWAQDLSGTPARGGFQIGAIEQEGTSGGLVKNECGPSEIEAEAAFQVEVLVPGDTGEIEHAGFESWILYEGEFYFAGADEG
jgi:hypothetical protein